MNQLIEKQKKALALFTPMWILGHADKLSIKIYNLNETDAKNSLKNHWSITDKNSLLNQIHIMSNANGHMDNYMKYHKLFLTMSDENINNYINKTNNDDLKKQLIIVNTYKYELINCGGIAFDICRGQYLASMGYICGYLNEDEAWNYILKTHNKFSNSFISWEQYMLSYSAGRQFWSSNLTQNYAEKEFLNKNIELFFKKNSFFKNFYNFK